MAPIDVSQLGISQSIYLLVLDMVRDTCPNRTPRLELTAQTLIRSVPRVSMIASCHSNNGFKKCNMVTAVVLTQLILNHKRQFDSRAKYTHNSEERLVEAECSVVHKRDSSIQIAFFTTFRKSIQLFAASRLYKYINSSFDLVRLGRPFYTPCLIYLEKCGRTFKWRCFDWHSLVPHKIAIVTWLSDAAFAFSMIEACHQSLPFCNSSRPMQAFQKRGIQNIQCVNYIKSSIASSEQQSLNLLLKDFSFFFLSHSKRSKLWVNQNASLHLIS